VNKRFSREENHAANAATNIQCATHKALHSEAPVYYEWVFFQQLIFWFL
jgi:hypothetical protein